MKKTNPVIFLAESRKLCSVEERNAGRNRSASLAFRSGWPLLRKSSYRLKNKYSGRSAPIQIVQGQNGARFFRERIKAMTVRKADANLQKRHETIRSSNQKLRFSFRLKRGWETKTNQSETTKGRYGEESMFRQISQREFSKCRRTPNVRVFINFIWHPA